MVKVVNKPKIALYPLIDESKDSYWMLPGYIEGIYKAGGMPIMLPLITNYQDIIQIVDSYDGFVLTGGQDVNPELYYEDNYYSKVHHDRDVMELLLIHEVLKRHKPILGICRGIQILNVAMGGSLYQEYQVIYILIMYRLLHMINLIIVFLL